MKKWTKTSYAVEKDKGINFNANYPIPLTNPIDAIKVKMDELGLKNIDLVGKVGSKGYISALLNKKKPLTLKLAKLFYKELNIPAEVFLS